MTKPADPGPLDPAARRALAKALVTDRPPSQEHLDRFEEIMGVPLSLDTSEPSDQRLSVASDAHLLAEVARRLERRA